MINEKETVRISKFLSLVLRHSPETIGIDLDSNGWADVDMLIEKTQKSDIVLDKDILRHVVETNPKKRFAFSDDQSKIRASQGHSINIELGYEPSQPPVILYHGTAKDNVVQILEQGLRKGQRHDVHLSADVETALNVGQRHGKPVVLEVLAGKMHTEGYKFFVSANGVWMTDAVPAQFLKQHV